MDYPQGLSFAPESRVILVGTTMCPKDQTHLPPLPHVARNIARLTELFTNPDVIGLPPSSIVPIVDEPEASAVVSAIAAAASEANDTLIVYYAGHGLYGDQWSPLYLATKNTVNAAKRWSGIDITSVKSAISSSPARKRILILDCCYSGAALKDGMSAQGAAVQEVLPAIDVNGTCGIAAVPGDYKALAPEGATYTKFTQHLIEVLERGIPGDAPVLSLGEVFNAVKTRVGRESNMPLPEQINSNECMLFHLAKNRYLRLAGLDQVFSGLARLGEAVERIDKRLEAHEAKLDAVAGLDPRLTALESQAATASRTPAGGPGTDVNSVQRWPTVLRTALLVALIDAITFVGIRLNAEISSGRGNSSVHDFVQFTIIAHACLMAFFFIAFVAAPRAEPPRRAEPLRTTLVVQIGIVGVFTQIGRYVSAGTMLVNSMLVLAVLMMLRGMFS
jgi:hypothetical protein